MREIKFRGWDSEKRQWVYPVRFSNRSTNGTLTADNPACLLSQFTGLKDKNGKDIYEGDIVHILSGETPYTVEWETAEFLLRSTNVGSKRLSFVFEDENIEIIGNVYAK